MPAPSMLSPWQVREKSHRMFSGTSTIFSMFCWARMGVPQAIEPTSGIFFILGIGSNPFGMGRGAGAGWERSASIGTS